jgi:hypothetical protein
MLDVEIAILSNRCGCSASRRRKRKILYAGGAIGLERFVACANLFLEDEKHRYAIEYQFRVKCTSRRSELWRRSGHEAADLLTGSNVNTVGSGNLGTWTDLCKVVDQFLGFPMAARPSYSTQAKPTNASTAIVQPEHAVSLLLDDDEQTILLNILFRMQQASGNYSNIHEPEVLSMHAKTSHNEQPLISLESWRDHAANTQTDGDATTASASTVFSRCQRKLVELRQLRETLDDNEDDDAAAGDT